MVYVACLLMGVVAGLRSMTAPAAVSWLAGLGWIDLGSSALAGVGNVWVRGVLTLLAAGEFVGDKLPQTPSRKALIPLLARLASGGFCGWVLGVSRGAAVGGLAAGAIGAAIGTIGGYEFRARLAKRIGKDLPAAVIEDILAVGGAVVAGVLLR